MKLKRILLALLLILTLAGTFLPAIPVSAYSDPTIFMEYYGSTASTMTWLVWVYDLGGYASGTLCLQYGTTNSYGSQTADISLNSTGKTKITISGLYEFQFYYVRARVIAGSNTGYQTGTGGTAHAEDSGPTCQTNVTVTNKSSTQATVSGSQLTSSSYSYGCAYFFEVADNSNFTGSWLAQATPSSYPYQQYGYLPVNFTAAITGNPGQTLYYRAFVTMWLGGVGVTRTVTLDTYDPQVTLNATTEILDTSAKLNATLTSKGSASTVGEWFQYGTTTSYGTDVLAGVTDGTGAYYYLITGLTANTTYHYRAKVVGDNTVYTADDSFTTSNTGVTLPAVTTGTSSSITNTTALVAGNVTSMGGKNALDCGFKYGSTLDTLGQVVFVVTSTGSIGLTLSGLQPGTVWYYRAYLHDTSADVYYYGQINSFTTTGMAPSSQVVTMGVSNITNSGAVLRGSLNSMGAATSLNYGFSWGRTTDYFSGGLDNGVSSANAGGTAYDVGEYNYQIGGLLPGTLYHYHFFVFIGGSKVDGGDRTFTTTGTPPSGSLQPTIVTLAPQGVSDTLAILNGELSDIGLSEFVDCYFECKRQNVVNDDEEQDGLSGTLKLPGTFSMSISNLRPGITYVYRASGHGLDWGYGSWVEFTTSANQSIYPIVVTRSVSDISGNFATFNGFAAAIGTANSSVQVGFDFRQDNGQIIAADVWHRVPVASMSAPGSFSVRMQNFIPNMPYRVRAYINGGADIFGSEVTFRTLAFGPTPTATPGPIAGGGSGGGSGGTPTTTPAATPPVLQSINDWISAKGFGNQTGHWIILIPLMIVTMIACFVMIKSKGAKVVVGVGLAACEFALALVSGWLDWYVVVILGLVVGFLVFGIVFKGRSGAN
jgi:hypothetical protein